jgi:hypothetical protein
MRPRRQRSASVAIAHAPSAAAAAAAAHAAPSVGHEGRVAHVDGGGAAAAHASAHLSARAFGHALAPALAPALALAPVPVVAARARGARGGCTLISRSVTCRGIGSELRSGWARGGLGVGLRFRLG